MKKIIFTIFIVSIFTACSVSSLAFNSQKKLLLQHNSNSYLLNTKVQEESFLSYQYIDIQRVSLKNEKNIKLFYENITMDINFEFRYSSLQTLKIIFDVNRTNLIYKKSNLLLTQFMLKDGSYINLMAETSGTQDMAYAYGFSNEEFKKIAKELGVKDVAFKDVVLLRKYISKWNQTKLILEPLVRPIGRGIY